QNADLAKRLGSLFEQKDDTESAFASYERALSLTRGSDPGLVRKVSNLKMGRTEREIAEHEEFLSTHKAKDAAHAKKTEELKAAKQKRAEILIEEASKRVEQNP